MKRRHYVEIAQAGDNVYARCRCRWRGTPYPFPAFATATDRERAILAAERECRRHEDEGALPSDQGRPEGGR